MKLTGSFPIVGLVALLSASVSNPSNADVQTTKPAVFSAQQAPIPDSCGTLQPLPIDINMDVFYKPSEAGKANEIDQNIIKDWRVQNRLYLDWKKKVMNLADSKWHKGDDNNGRCAVAFIDALTYNDSMLGKELGNNNGMQAHYQRKYTLNSVGASYLKVRHLATAEQDARIKWWMMQVAKKVLYFWEVKERNHVKNNHYPMAGVGVMIAGILNQDKEMIAWSKNTFFTLVSSVNKDGYLPTEITRQRLALHYHHHSMTALATLATLSTMIGEDWGADERYQKLITTITDATIDPTAFENAAGVKQVPFDGNEKSMTTYFMPWYGLLPDNDSRLVKITNAFGKEKVLINDVETGGDQKILRRLILAAPKVTIN